MCTKGTIKNTQNVVEIELATELFRKDKVMEMIKEDQQQEVKKYIKKYFFKVLNPVCIFYYNVLDSTFNQVSYEDFGKGYITPTMVYKVISGEKIKTVKYNEWFKNEDTDDYLLTFDVSKPRVYEEKGIRYINMFKGFKYGEMKVPEITESNQEKINIIWNHIREVICSNDETAYQYMRKWISHFINGRKMKTALYLKGVQGAGKSTLPKFLMNVIGERNVFFTQSNNCLINRFNAELQGIVLLFLDELRCANTSEWKIMNSTLNVLTTEDYVSIEAKGKDPINIKNHISIIITSNDSPVQMNKNDRRYLMTDISNKRMGDVEYFNKLYNCLDDSEVQKAFYWECKRIANESPFNEQSELKNVETEAKSEVLIKNLHPLYQYVKNQYVLKRKDFNTFLRDLTEFYNRDTNSKSTSIEISRLLKEIGIIGKSSTGNLHRYKYTHNEILEIYKKNKWMHEMDEFEPEKRPKSMFPEPRVEKKKIDINDEGYDLLTTDQEEIYQLDDKVAKMAEQIEQMTRQLEEMQKYKSLYEELLKSQQPTKPECKKITTKSNQSLDCEAREKMEEDKKVVKKVVKKKNEKIEKPCMIKSLEATLNGNILPKREYTKKEIKEEENDLNQMFTLK